MNLILKSKVFDARGKLLLPLGNIVFACLVIAISWHVLPSAWHLVGQLWPEFYIFFGVVSVLFVMLCYMEKWK